MVPIINDNAFEGSEQFTARLSLPAGQTGVVLGARMATVESTDDDCKLSWFLLFTLLDFCVMNIINLTQMAVCPWTTEAKLEPCSQAPPSFLSLAVQKSVESLVFFLT